MIHISHTDADETHSGIPLAVLLDKAGALCGSGPRPKALDQYIVASGSDGYQTVVALGEVDPQFHPGKVLVADAMDGGHSIPIPAP